VRRNRSNQSIVVSRNGIVLLILVETVDLLCSTSHPVRSYNVLVFVSHLMCLEARHAKRIAAQVQSALMSGSSEFKAQRN
jgi:hypothetical protein